MKNVLITGAGRGYGLELVKVFSKNDWQVYATCRTVGDFPAELKAGNIEVIELNVADEQSIANLVKTMGDEPLDVLINNAGVYDAPKASAAPRPQNMQSLTKIYQVNAIAPRLVAQALAANLTKSELKTVVNISSYMSSFELANSFNMLHWAYSSSKAAMNYAMLAFADQHPELTVGLIHPGWLRTEMGGSEASTDPAESAQDLFSLISSGQIKPRVMTDTQGNPLPF